jgi:hypothetical protein
MSINNAHILVVDDNPATLYSTSRVLRSAGWTVSEAETGLIALEKVQSGVDLVVLDVNLPDMDGFDVCRRIRENESTSRLPVLHLSATFVQDVHKIHGLDAGADGYLTHPIEPPVLIATVNAFLRARQAEIDLRESESRFRAIFEQAPNGVALLTDDLVFVVVNPAMSKMLGSDSDSICRRSIQEFVTAETKARLADVHREIKDARSWRGIMALESVDGNTITTEWNVSTHASPGLWLAIVDDITERIKYESERERLLLSEQNARVDAERATRYKDDFIATMSHELRTPLNAILGWSQVMKLSNLGPSEMQDAIETIERNARMQADMIADLLDVSRITSGQIRLELRQVVPADVIDAAVAAVLPTANDKTIRIDKLVDRSTPPIFVDAARLQQIVWNLLVNAIKFTPEGGAIEVSLEQVHSAVEIRVHDNGIGLSPTLLPQVFDRFRQGDASTTRQHAGLGLGLAIVKQLVEMHGGTVLAESPGEGLGTTFTVRLPINGTKLSPLTLSKTYVQPVRPPLTEPEFVDLSGIRVLIVEDDEDSRTLLARIVGDCGGVVRAASSVVEALEGIDAFQPDILVSDLGMPRQDGFELIQSVRDRGYSLKRLPAIALSAFADSKSRQRALLAGFQGNLAKPIESREIAAAIAALVGRTG